ncbi:MAG: hypothetical protein AB7Q42_10910 [Acidimicrobiia bacterium]
MPASRSGLPNGRFVLWIVRLLWVAQVLLVGPAIGQALADQSRPVQVTGTVGAWAMWFAAVVATFLPSAVSLTALRMVVPGTILVALAAGAAGASVTAFVVALASSLVVTLVAFSGDVGQTFVQRSAYGDESRLPLRPPGTLLLGPIPLLWSTTAVAVIAGPLLLAARAWLIGSAVTLAAAGLGIVAATRFHRLARRWLVLVPAGLVVHDALVLAETVMFPRDDVEAIGLALADTEAADLTGDALGPAIEIRLVGTGTVVLAASSSKPAGTALHVRAILISPSRPGRLIVEAARRRVGR